MKLQSLAQLALQYCFNTWLLALEYWLKNDPEAHSESIERLFNFDYGAGLSFVPSTRTSRIFLLCQCQAQLQRKKCQWPNISPSQATPSALARTSNAQATVVF